VNSQLQTSRYIRTFFIDEKFATEPPGIPLGKVHVVDGPMCCASRGIILNFKGRTAHASQPETGISPMPALARLMPELSELSSPLGTSTNDPDFTLVTITHADMGAPAFGVAPGEGNLFATLRTLTDEGMEKLVNKVEAIAKDAAHSYGLKLSIDYTDVFVTCRNDVEATTILLSALDDIAVEYDAGDLPMRGSEDFGYFGRGAKMALLLVGSGENLPSLHNPDFDFPDELIDIGSKIYSAICHRIFAAQ
jgi:metal-dependent amidase/aminoacylase/carboxypeptidase family protein